MKVSGAPSQAVILAGGRGTRLRPITDRLPKPMVEIHGTPFLEYLVRMLREQGFERVLMLLGYMPEAITGYFGDGSRFGVRIDYSILGEDALTGTRLKHALPQLDPAFLLMYCDNYWPVQSARMWKHFAASAAAAMLTIYRNDDAYTRHNVRIESGYVVERDGSRKAPGLSGVDIGFAYFKRQALALLPDTNVMLEDTLYPALAARRQLLAYVTGHRYYSVGSIERLPATDRFLARKPAVILDRDGVLNRKPPRAQYVRRWSDFEWLPGSLEALRELRDAGYTVVVATNQAGVARGALTLDELSEIHRRMAAEAAEAGGAIDRIYVCPHGWDDGCACRKPRPGMLIQAQRDFALDLTRTVFIGDDDRDREAAEAAGCVPVLVSSETGLLNVTRGLLRGKTRQAGAAITI